MRKRLNVQNDRRMARCPHCAESSARYVRRDSSRLSSPGMPWPVPRTGQDVTSRTITCLRHCCSQSVWSSLERASAHSWTWWGQAGRRLSPVAAGPSRTSLLIGSARSGASGREIDNRYGRGITAPDCAPPHPSGSWRSIVTNRHDSQNVETTGHLCVRPDAAWCIA